MTKQHKATPEQWAYAETCAPEDFAGYACILELRARVEALEVGQQPPQDKLDRLIALDRDDPANSLVDRIATDAELCQVYSAALLHGFGPALRAVYDLGREDGAAPTQPSPESSPAGSLVDRVQQSIDDHPFGEEARAAILEVAAALIDRWDSEGGSAWEAAKWLEREASR
jgi:hypothetical protein